MSLFNGCISLLMGLLVLEASGHENDRLCHSPTVTPTPSSPAPSPATSTTRSSDTWTTTTLPTVNTTIINATAGTSNSTRATGHWTTTSLPTSTITTVNTRDPNSMANYTTTTTNFTVNYTTTRVPNTTANSTSRIPTSTTHHTTIRAPNSTTSNATSRPPYSTANYTATTPYSTVNYTTRALNSTSNYTTTQAPNSTVNSTSRIPTSTTHPTTIRAPNSTTSNATTRVPISTANYTTIKTPNSTGNYTTTTPYSTVNYTTRAPNFTSSYTTTRAPNSTANFTSIIPTSTKHDTTTRAPNSTTSDTTTRAPNSTTSDTTTRAPNSTTSDTTTRAPNSTPCNTTRAPTSLPSSTTRAPLPGRPVTAVDVTHTYIDVYGSVKTVTQRRVLIHNGNLAIVTFYAKSNSGFNPRELMLQFDSNVVTASIGKHYKFYNSVTLETNVQWACLERSLNQGGLASLTFSEYGSYRAGRISWLRDRVEVHVADGDQPISELPDQECFEMAFPMHATEATSGRTEDDGHGVTQTAALNVTQMAYRQVNHGTWCCFNETLETRLLNFTDGETRVLQIHYEPSPAGGFDLKNRNPRNVTIAFQDGRFHVAMAKLSQVKYADAGSGSGWQTSEEWTCRESSVTLEAAKWEAVRRLTLYEGVQSSASYVRREGFLLLSATATATTTATPGR